MKLNSIQILRGIAAMLVVVYHTRSIEGEMLKGVASGEVPWVGGLWTNGYAGVDLFFVISGFIMVYVTATAGRGRQTAGAFLFARATRIYPLWWLFAGIFALYMLTAHVILDVEGLGWQAIGDGLNPLEYLLKSFALWPQATFPILGVGWTLVHEMYFYFVFALILLVPARWLGACLAAWAVFVIIGSNAGLSGPYANDLLALITYPMTMEFILGAGAGMLVLSGRRWRPGVVTTIAAIWLTAALCLQGVETADTLMWGRVLWFGLPSALLIYGFASVEISRRMILLVPACAAAFGMAVAYQILGPAIPLQPIATKANALEVAGIVQTLNLSGQIVWGYFVAIMPALAAGLLTCSAVLNIGWWMGQSHPETLRRAGPPLQSVANGLTRLGDWSFALYLSHMLVLSALRRIFPVIGNLLEGVGLPISLANLFRVGTPGILDNALFVGTGVTACIIVSWISYRWFEKPLIRFFSRLRTKWFGETVAKARPAEIKAAIW